MSEQPVFKNPVCRGSIALGTACGHCERCEWQRNRHKEASKYQLVGSSLTPSQDTVEAVARAAYGGDFTKLGPDSQRYWRELAERTIAAYEARRK